MRHVSPVAHVLPELAKRAIAFDFCETARRAAAEAVVDTVTAAAAAPLFGLTEAVREVYGGGTAAIWFTGRTASPIGAGFANAMSAAALDLDDGHRGSRGHPGAAVVPAVFADLSRLPDDRSKAMDAAVLRAIAVGYEVGLRIASAKSFYARTGYWAGIAAAAAVASLRQVSDDAFARALAIAAETGPHMCTTTAPPAWPQPAGTEIKEGIPWGVASGMMAVPLALGGLTGPLDIVDHAPFFDADTILAHRDRPMVCDTYTKFQAACRHVHAPVEAVCALMAEHDLAWSDLEEIAVQAYSGALRIANTPAPATVVDAHYSIPYCIGLAAVRGIDALITMRQSELGIAEAEAVARRVTITVNPQLEAQFPDKTLTCVTLKTARGTFASAVTSPSGEADNRPDWSKREKKFLAVTDGRLSQRDQADLLVALEEARDGRLEALRARLRVRQARPPAR